MYSNIVLYKLATNRNSWVLTNIIGLTLGIFKIILLKKLYNFILSFVCVFELFEDVLFYFLQEKYPRLRLGVTFTPCP